MQLVKRLIIITCVTLIFACSTEQQPTLRVAHNNWPGYQSLSLAKDLGFIDKSFEVTRIANASDVLTAFKDDMVDIAALTLDEVLLLQSQNSEPIQVILVLDISNGADVIISRAAIRSINELSGKRVGVESSALGAFVLSRALSLKSQLSLSDLNILPLTHDKHFDSFVNHEVDAVVTFEPVSSMLLERGGCHVIFDSGMIPGEIVDVLVTKQKTAELNAKRISALIKGYFATQAYIRDNPTRANQRMADYQGISRAEFVASKKRIIIPNLTSNRKLLMQSGQGISQTIDKLRLVMLEQNIISHWNKNHILVSGDFLPD